MAEIKLQVSFDSSNNYIYFNFSMSYSAYFFTTFVHIYWLMFIVSSRVRKGSTPKLFLLWEQKCLEPALDLLVIKSACLNLIPVLRELEVLSRRSLSVSNFIKISFSFV